MKGILTVLLLLISLLSVSAQSAPASTPDSLPRIFELGNFSESAFEKIKAEYETTLFAASKNDVETSYYCWIHLLKHFESFAQKRNVDISGVKMWLYVFWDKDGTINHMGYFLKPHSRNIEPEVVKALLSNFSDEYKFPLKSEKRFSNYNSANFPVNIEKTIPENK